jgi:hypothetical protein
MQNEDSSTLSEQSENTTVILQFFLLNCKVVLEPTSDSADENRRGVVNERVIR